MSNLNLEKDVLQYTEELQKNYKEIEDNILKIHAEKIREFKNSVNNISNNCISDIQLLVNRTNSKLKSNISNNKIDEGVLDEFNLSVQAIIMQAKNDLDTYKNNFDIDIANSIDSEVLKLKNFINENSDKIQKSLQAALYQINQSENSALNKLEETYDLGVETIVSAEKTALRNLKLLSEKLELELESKVEQIEGVINDKLSEALAQIKDVEEKALNNISKLEITLKNELQVEKDRIIAEVKKMIEDFEFTLQGYVDEMKAELTAHKDELLKEISLNKEEIFIELDKVKNGIIEACREEEYRIIQNLNDREQEIIAEIIATVNGFDLELEIIKAAKIKEFLEAINLIKEQCLNDVITLTEDCLLELKNSTNVHLEELLTATALHLIELRNAVLAYEQNAKDNIIEETNKQLDNIVAKGEEVVDGIVGASKEEIHKYISNLQEQRFVTILPANENVIQLPQTYTLNDRVKLFIDGLMILPDGFFTLDKLERRIILNESYEYDTNVVVVADLPDANMEAIKDQLYVDGWKFLEDAVLKIYNSGNIQVENILQTSVNAKSEIELLGINQTNAVNTAGSKYLTELQENYTKDIENWKSLFNNDIKILNENYDLYIAELKKIYNKYYDEIFKTSDSKIQELNNLANNKIENINSLSTTFLNLLNQTFTDLNNQATQKLNANLVTLENKIQDGFERIEEKTNNCVNDVVNDIKDEVREYIETFREGVYATEIVPYQSAVQVPIDELVINRSVKVYFDGILQIYKKHYKIDFLTNSISILNPFSYHVDVLFLQNLPVTNLPKREATDAEIDALFEQPYRLGTDNDIDGLYSQKKEASESDIDALFK